MTTSIFNRGFFRVISDGDKLIIIGDYNGRRECYQFTAPLLTGFRINVDNHIIRDSLIDSRFNYLMGLPEYNVDLSFTGSEVKLIDKPLIMGVDIFDKLSVTDYLDVINEKIKRRSA